jgi:hypothetical protein
MYGIFPLIRKRSRRLVGALEDRFLEIPGDMRGPRISTLWHAPGSEDTELGVFMGPEVSHGETKVYPGVQA